MAAFTSNEVNSINIHIQFGQYQADFTSKIYKNVLAGMKLVQKNTFDIPIHKRVDPQVRPMSCFFLFVVFKVLGRQTSLFQQKRFHTFVNGLAANRLFKSISPCRSFTLFYPVLQGSTVDAYF